MQSAAYLVFCEGCRPVRQNSKKHLLVNTSSCSIVLDHDNWQRLHCLRVFHSPTLSRKLVFVRLLLCTIHAYQAIFDRIEVRKLAIALEQLVAYSKFAYNTVPRDTVESWVVPRPGANTRASPRFLSSSCLGSLCSFDRALCRAMKSMINTL